MYNINQQAFEKALENEKEDSDVCLMKRSSPFFHIYIHTIILIINYIFLE